MSFIIVLNFSIIYVFEVKESFDDIHSRVLRVTDDCVLLNFTISQLLRFLRSTNPLQSIAMCSGYYSGLWTRRFLVRVPSGCQYSMRLDRLHRAYPILHPFGVVYWVPVLSNIKTATGCEWNRQLQLWTVFERTVVNNNQFNGIQGWVVQLCRIRCRAII